MLEKFGVPAVLLSVVHPLHSDMWAAVCVGSNCSDSFTVRNVVHQGCTTALFNLYFCSVFDYWWWQCSWAVLFHYLHGRKWFSDHTANSHLLQSCISNLMILHCMLLLGRVLRWSLLDLFHWQDYGAR